MARERNALDSAPSCERAASAAASSLHARARANPLTHSHPSPAFKPPALRTARNTAAVRPTGLSIAQVLFFHSFLRAYI